MAKESRRRCLGCRKSGLKRTLLRFVVGEKNALRVDSQHSLPGRGAYLHNAWSCIRSALERGRWEHALRIERGSLDATTFDELLNGYLGKLSDSVDGLVEAPSGVAGKGRLVDKGAVKGGATRKKVRL